MASDVIPAPGMSGKEISVAITAQAALNAPLASNSAHTETAASQGATTPGGKDNCPSIEWNERSAIQ